jgi:hypothetical protein
MIQPDVFWQALELDERKILLVAIYQHLLERVAETESKRQWHELLPSVRQGLTDADWSTILEQYTQPNLASLNIRSHGSPT